jgi:hypothetical protein
MKERFNHFRVGLRLLHSGALMERYRNRYVALHRAVGGGAATVTLRVTPMLSDIPRYFPRALSAASCGYQRSAYVVL